LKKTDKKGRERRVTRLTTTQPLREWTTHRTKDTIVLDFTHYSKKNGFAKNSGGSEEREGGNSMEDH